MRTVAAAWILLLLLPAWAPSGEAPQALPQKIAFEVRDAGDVAWVDAVVRRGEAAWVARVPEAGFVVVETARPWEILARVPLPAHVEQTGTARAAWMPDDPLYPAQWHLAAVRAPEAWERTRGTRSVLVAVVDSGATFGHPDLTDARLLRGKDFVDDDDDPSDLFGHGTHVTGTIVAVGGNGIGGSGIADVSILVLRVLDRFGGGSCLDVALGVIEAARAKADVVNLSVYCSRDDPILRLATAYAHAQGAVLVAAAGNVQQDAPERCIQYPARYPGVVAVGALDADFQVTSWSCRGPELGLVAPGVDVLATGMDGYERRTGTSMAAPQVAAAAALVKSLCPAFEGDAIADVLRAAAADLGPAGHDPQHGHGMLDLGRTLVLAEGDVRCAMRAARTS